MIITPLASGSSGNCYHVTDGAASLLLECGLRYQDISVGLGFMVPSLDGVLISHAHKDHSRAAVDIAWRGVDVYASGPTLNAQELSGHRFHEIRAGEQFKIMDWTVLPFPTEHDCDGSLGFLIAGPSGEKLLYASDTFYIRHRFKGLNYIMLEINYDGEILDENVRSGEVHQALRRRVRRSHMSLDTALEFFRANDLEGLREVYLLHLSSTNSDAQAFKRAVQEVVGVPVYVC